MESKDEVMVVEFPPEPGWTKVLITYMRNPNFTIGLIITLIVVLVALTSLVYTPQDPNAMAIGKRLLPLGPGHPLGTDEYGRDILSRLMAGARSAVTVGLISVGTGTTLGVLIGAIAGFYRGVVDDILMRVMDGLYAFPTILFAIMVVSVLGPGMFNTIIAIGIANIPIFARITRGNFLALREKEFVKAAQSLGAGSFRVITVHLLLNTLAPIIVQATVSFAMAIIAESSLSYLGLGTQPPDPSWGRMLKEAQSFLSIAPWISILPGISIAITVLGFNLLGDGLRDITDPRTVKD